VWGVDRRRFEGGREEGAHGVGDAVMQRNYIPRTGGEGSSPPPDEPASISNASGRAAILDQAREAVTRDRAATHGAVESSFAQIAAIWSVRLGVPVTPAQVAILLIDLKTVRGWGNPGHLDNWVDMAGYAACGGELAVVPGAGGGT